MGYKFNHHRFAQLCSERNLNNVALQGALEMTNTTPINRWRNGEHMRSEHIARVCNAFGISPAEFFMCDDKPIEAPELTIASHASTDEHIVQLESIKREMEYVKEKADIERQHLQEMADMKCEHTKELMQKDIDLARKESIMREEIRTEMKLEYEKEITSLRTQLIELTSQYRELEIVTSGHRINAVAEGKGSNYITTGK